MSCSVILRQGRNEPNTYKYIYIYIYIYKVAECYKVYINFLFTIRRVFTAVFQTREYHPFVVALKHNYTGCYVS